MLYVLSSLFVSAHALGAPAESADGASPGEHSVASGAHVEPVSASGRTSLTGDRLAFLAHVGIGAPGGALGLDFDLAPIRYLAFDLSVGVSPAGPQLALMPRLRAPIGAQEAGRGTFLTFGVGPSFGQYLNANESAGLGCLLLLCGLGEAPATQTYARATWVNFELGLDVYTGERSLLRTTLGYGFIANAQDYVCKASQSGDDYPPGGGCDRSSGQSLAFATLAYGFDL